MGRYTRRLREFVGLSQEQLARLAGVSQGAVSRLEMGRAVNTPLIIVMKINAAMREALAEVDPKLLSTETRKLMAVRGRGVPSTETAFDQFPVAVEPQLTEMVRLFRRVPIKNRDRLLTLVRAAVAALGSDAPGRRRPSG
ncbi:MAG TPA: helix-turn-helix transcriptional regulator [Candidatus Binatia bacterium]|nr:helix-turn-helix transcriptional regulator [Candidatus Binatia bacterium]